MLAYDFKLIPTFLIDPILFMTEQNLRNNLIRITSSSKKAESDSDSDKVQELTNDVDGASRKQDQQRFKMNQVTQSLQQMDTELQDLEFMVSKNNK
eukprot:CAMPEP_0116898220 /NCGR_PEP_ID=MMETSP0467-20121206/6981_1 /TAXON_ID=283647 /ORGANISM="Mesodinium pulex, Strain SPMC105" /LENGTH=95 /DNA_ID=CAMNT_0004570207 /DNA_START=1117 /DNA_END=1404 /DNA_ORIENTATION=+